MDLSRRSLLVSGGAAAAAAAGLAGCGGGGSSGEGGGGGNSGPLRVTLVNHVWTENIKQKIAEFEQQNNVKVEVTQLGEDQLSAQYNVKLNAGSSELDVMMYRPLQEGKLFAKNKYLMDLTDKVKDKDFDWGDFIDSPKGACTYRDKVVGIPLFTERECLYYRKDLLEKHGLQVPKTLDEMEQAAKKIKEAEAANGIAGFVARTDKSAAVTMFSSYLYSFGGDFEKDGKATINTEEAKKAYAYYGRMIREYGPANVSTSMGWPDAMAIFTQGKALFLTDADSLYKNATDPAKSQVSDKVEFAVFPAGPGGQKPFDIPPWGLAINDASKNKDLAWKFVQWSASKAAMLEQQKGGLPSSRKSTWENAEALTVFPKTMADAIQAAQKVGGVDHDRPVVVQVAKAREIVGQPIVDAITGKDSNASADAAQTAFQKFLDDENK